MPGLMVLSFEDPYVFCYQCCYLHYRVNSANTIAAILTASDVVATATEVAGATDCVVSAGANGISGSSRCVTVSSLDIMSIP